MDDVERQYSGSGERWDWWYAIAVCKPLPSADESHIVSGSGVQPTVYGACLDNAYLANRELINDGEVLVGVSAWLCRGYLPEPPGALPLDLNCYLAIWKTAHERTARAAGEAQWPSP